MEPQYMPQHYTNFNVRIINNNKGNRITSVDFWYCIVFPLFDLN